MNIYVLSGLGADRRVFDKIDFGPHYIAFIDWVRPLRNETLSMYAGRLRQQIHHEDAVLIGLSFGGIAALELARQVHVERVILINSVCAGREIPFWLRLAGRLRLHKLIPGKLLQADNFLVRWFFGIETHEAKLLLSQILSDTDPSFLAWAIDNALLWSGSSSPGRILRIHGTADRIFPICKHYKGIRVDGGGHFMTAEQPGQVSAALKTCLEHDNRF